MTQSIHEEIDKIRDKITEELKTFLLAVPLTDTQTTLLISKCCNIYIEGQKNVINEMRETFYAK